MSERQQGLYDAIARKWLALAERRQAQLLELRANGRWRHYFTEGELDRQLREVSLACARFAEVAGLEPQTGRAAAADRRRGLVPPHAGERLSRSRRSLEAAIEAALSAATTLQENAA